MIRLPVSDFGMPVFHIKKKMDSDDCYSVATAGKKEVIFLFFQGAYVSSDMDGKQIFRTLSAGIMFTGIAAGFVERNGISGRYFKSFKEKMES